MIATLVESPEQISQSSPFPVKFNPKISPLAGLIVHLQVVENALEIQATDLQVVDIRVEIAATSGDPMTRELHVNIPLHVQPKIIVWTVWMSTPDLPESEPYQAVFDGEAYYVCHLETKPE